ncbi:hypothetical protein NX774_08165 [Massilia agilis]|uniref:Uncharacterized protein n=1 Tax=Massilia agilis TaxID=1811226 RepID=A0ABT2D9C6_9BURK|nr:hypothetical protein [Massilia agilis]MCS0807896.1 hypothetical protein [Massilia agilis]
MSLTWMVIVVLAALAVAAAVLMNARRSPGQQPAARSDSSEQSGVTGSLDAAEDARPQRIVVGASPDRPLMSVQLVDEVPVWANASPSSALAAPTVERISTVL